MTAMAKGAVILNGYFRSGTSILWRLLRDANPARAVIYEPCHNDLFTAIEMARNGRHSDLHQFPVWGDYLTLSEVQLARLRWSHPCLAGRVLPGDTAALLRYLATLRSVFGSDAVLQTNRWHFQLGQLAEADAEIFHVVRNPLAVYRSIVVGSDYRRRRNPLIRARRLFNPAEQFYGWRIANEIAPRYGTRLSSWLRWRPFDVFVYCWVLANAAALDALGASRLFSYEEICLAPSRFQSALHGAGLAADFSAMRPAPAMTATEFAAIDEACAGLRIERWWRPLRRFLQDNMARLPVACAERATGLRVVAGQSLP